MPSKPTGEGRPAKLHRRTVEITDQWSQESNQTDDRGSGEEGNPHQCFECYEQNIYVIFSL